MPTFNFSSYYLNTNLSDLDIVITVPEDGSSHSRKTAEQLPGHGIVLANVSCLFKAQIEHQTAKHARITLDVRHDQVPAARALVQYVYTGILPEYAQHPEQEPLLVHMLHLAHVYRVQDCAAACLHALMGTPQLQPETVHLVYSLLSGATDLPGFAQLMEHCSNHLHQQFGNLEATMSDLGLIDKLHKLPHAAVLALLEDERTEAAAENTVLAAVQSWLAHQPERVDLQQRQQLAGAVRIPQLEPMYLATVLPRIPWLVEVLGPRGLAMAAAAGKGMYDVHTAPVLSNADVCGALTAAWMKGMRRQPDSCMLGPNEPGIHIEWSLPLSQVKRAFTAACAAASASVDRLQAGTAHAALTGQPGAEPAVPGQTQLHGWGSSGAAAVSAAAAAAMSLGANMFRKRKRSNAMDEHTASASVPPSPLAAVAEHDDADSAEGAGRARKQQRRAQLPGLHCPASDPTSASHDAATAAAAIAGAEAAAAAASSRAHNVTLQHCDTPTATGAATVQHGSGQPTADLSGIKAYSQEVIYAGYSWRLVLYFEARVKQRVDAAEHSRSAAAAVNAAVIAGGSGRQTCPAAAAHTLATTAEARSPHQQRAPLFMFGRNNRGNTSRPEEGAPAAWVQQDLGSLQTPWGSRRGFKSPRSPPPAFLGDQAADEHSMPVQHARQAVAVAAAMKLPDDSSPVAEAGQAGQDEQQAGVYAQDSCGWEWHARLAIEAWPCIALQPGVSVAAFSASLAAKKKASGSQNPAVVGDRAGSRAGQVSASIAAAGAGGSNRAAAGHQSRQAPTRHRLASNGAGAAASSRILAAAAPGAVGQASARATRSSSNHVEVEAVDPAAAAAGGLSALQALGHRSSTGHRRRAAAVAAQQKILQQQQQAGRVLPVSDEPHEPEVVVDDSSDDQAGGASPTAATAVDEHDSGAAWGSSASDYESDHDEEGHAAAEKENQGVTHLDAPASKHGKIPTAAGQDLGSSCQRAGDSKSSSGWLVCRMPQGRYVKSRKCDQGYSNFFQLTLQQGQWDAAAWSDYVQPGGMLHIRGTIWNVR